LPGARLICGLRHPVDRAYSDFLMHLRNRGRRLDPARDLTPAAAWAQPDSHWMRIGRYHPQLQRYYDAFARSQLHVFLFDDLKTDALGTVQTMYRFLGIDPTFVPDLATPHNVGGLPASMFLEKLFTNKVIKSAVAPLVSSKTANWVRRLRAKNMRKPPSLPRQLKQELTAHFREDIERTSELIGRSLKHWL
jgi:hypothetical protein